MVLVHVFDDAGLVGDKRQGRRLGLQDVGGGDPLDLAEAGDQMTTRDLDPVKTEIGKVDIGCRVGVTGEEASAMARLGTFDGMTLERQTRARQPACETGSAVEQERDVCVLLDIPGVFGKRGKQKDRRRIVVGGDKHKRGIGLARRRIDRRQGTGIASPY